MPDAMNRECREADNIWLTSKARMQAETRYKTYSLTSHLLLSYYALLMVVYSIFSDSITTSLSLAQINIALSTAIFGVSLIVYGFKFGQTAQLHRECYLRLQRLIALVDDEHELKVQYHEIIAGYPNHSAKDYDDLIIDRTFMKNESIYNSNGSVNWTNSMLGWKIIRLLTFWLIIINLALWPIYFLLYPLLGGQP